MGYQASGASAVKYNCLRAHFRVNSTHTRSGRSGNGRDRANCVEGGPLCAPAKRITLTLERARRVRDLDPLPRERYRSLCSMSTLASRRSGPETRKRQNTAAAGHGDHHRLGGPRAGDVVACGPVRVARARSETLKARGPVRDAQAAPTSRRGPGEKYITNRWRRSKGRAANAVFLASSLRQVALPARNFRKIWPTAGALVPRLWPTACRVPGAFRSAGVSRGTSQAPSSDSPNLLAEGTLPSFEMHRQTSCTMVAGRGRCMLHDERRRIRDGY